MVLYKLEDIVKRWSECTFGTLQINRWLVGKGSWHMLESEQERLLRFLSIVILY
jgi:hypothetical protein